MKSNETAYMGQLFGRLTVLREAGRSKISGNILWECQCSCGNVHVSTKSQITRGVTRSCGCLLKDRFTTHGLSHHQLYGVFKNARRRCTSNKCNYWEHYGGRGIEFRLNTVTEFVAKMLPTWFEGASLDRIDTNGHYEYDNIRWATSKEQNRNMRSNVYITYYNVTLTLADWAKELGISAKGFAWRINHWSVEKSITTPVIKRNYNAP